MRLVVMLSICGLSFLGSGCALVHDTATSFAFSLARPVEECLEKYENKKAAKAAWWEVSAEGEYSEHYGKGFKHGFAEYLFRGGNGQPPVVAPPCYRSICYQNPEGHEMVQDWFAGYRHGADAAKQSGLRRFIIAPSALANLAAAPDPVAPEIPESPGGPPIETKRNRRLPPALAKKAPPRFPSGDALVLPKGHGVTPVRHDLPLPKFAAPEALPAPKAVMPPGAELGPLPAFGVPGAWASAPTDGRKTAETK